MAKLKVLFVLFLGLVLISLCVGSSLNKNGFTARLVTGRENKAAIDEAEAQAKLLKAESENQDTLVFNANTMPIRVQEEGRRQKALTLGIYVLLGFEVVALIFIGVLIYRKIRSPIVVDCKTGHTVIVFPGKREPMVLTSPQRSRAINRAQLLQGGETSLISPKTGTGSNNSESFGEVVETSETWYSNGDSY
jgi:hypothetical protein